MKASEYIAVIQQLINENGDLEVQKWMPAKGRHEAPRPEIGYKRIHPAKRGTETLGAAFYHCTDTPTQKGDPVIRV